MISDCSWNTSRRSFLCQMPRLQAWEAPPQTALQGGMQGQHLHIRPTSPVKYMPCCLQVIRPE